MSMTGRLLLIVFIASVTGAVAMAAQGEISYLLCVMVVISGVAFALVGGDE